MSEKAPHGQSLAVQTYGEEERVGMRIQLEEEGGEGKDTSREGEREKS